ncbi:GIY-YIG nuclease family protein [Ilyomonas limi]|uniref:GIY-YIG nuclease family protein n=1 Tax=Ilyomonas limi TaxID=2575867 RepID=A0A4U3KSX1_9BACT|nr:GIY-YIG nuclease family protein [Ilyomonas limi]TKK65420.1 GIY-YIG nuclease family protein [Ilyomonas limi]
MQSKKKLKDIFEDDPFGLLNTKHSASPARNANERLIASFQEIVDFYEKYNREPEQGGSIQEHQLYSRLKGIRENREKKQLLKEYDRFGLLDYEQKQIASLNDILNDDTFGILDDPAEELYELKHIKSPDDRTTTDFVAKRKPCKDFNKYEAAFKEVQKDLSTGKRKLISFKQDNLRAGDFYVHNGILLFLESVKFDEHEQKYKGESKKDGRTRIIFENGTESNMLYRSLYKALLANGKAVSENQDKVNEDFAQKFSTVNEDDIESGYIYILKSQSDKPELKSIPNLYKIGYSKMPVEERIKNAHQEPTYLFADVHLITFYKCYNLNPQKFEQLIHNFFGAVCLNVDVFDSTGKRYIPREWFVVPLPIIEEAIKLITSGEIINYRYDNLKDVIVSR